MIGKRSVSKPKDSIRVCVLIDAWEPMWGGGQTHVWEISKKLVNQHDCNITIFTRALKADSLDKSFNYPQIYYNNKLKVIRIGPLTKFFNPFGRLFWLITVVFAIYIQHKNNPYDIIHAHAYLGGLPGKCLSIILGIPIVFTVHGSNNLDQKRNSLKKYIENFILTKIKYTKETSVSNHFLEYPNSNKNIVVISNGVDVDLFNRKVKNSKRNDKCTFLWVGRYEKLKGINILLKALREIIIVYPDIELILVGHGNEKKSLKKLSHDLGLDRFVKFMGRKKTSQLIQLYKSADIFVLPSLSEGQPIVLLEAFAAKLPVIATDVGDNAYIIKNNINGFIVTPGNYTDLKNTLLKTYRLYKRKKLYSLGKEGYKLVKQKYSWDLAAQRFFNVYMNLLKK